MENVIEEKVQTKKETFWDRIIYSNIHKTPLNVLYAAYLKFMSEHNDDDSYGNAFNRKDFAERLRLKHINVRPSNGNKMYAFGVRLKDEFIQNQEDIEKIVKNRVFEVDNPNMYTITARMYGGSMVATIPSAFRKRFNIQEGETLVCEFDGECLKYYRYAAFEPKQEVVRD